MLDQFVSKHSAPGPMAGFTFQWFRALLWLSRVISEDIVAIETLDDVTILEENGNLIFEQDKHSIDLKSNNLTDGSIALWNTFQIWLSIFESDNIEKEKVNFLLVTNTSIPSVSILNRIRKATTSADYQKCVSKLRSYKPSKSIVEIVKKVLKYDDSLLINFLKKIDVVYPEIVKTETLSEIKKNFRIPSNLDDQTDSILNEMIGWIQQTTMRSWYKKKPAIIKGQSFINALHKSIRSRIKEKTLERSAHLVKVPRDQADKHRGNQFVKQMMLISEDDNEIDDTIDDFVRASNELLRLSDEGELTPRDLKELEYNLVDRWKPIRRRTIRIHKNIDKNEVGYLIFDETTNNYLVIVKGVPTEHSYFTRGVYHRLSDVLKVGWHPDFEELLKK